MTSKSNTPTEINPWVGLEQASNPIGDGYMKRLENLSAKSHDLLIAMKRNEPLNPELSAWLAAALQNIACGKDPYECLNIQTDFPGQKRTLFLQKMQTLFANSLNAEVTDKEDPLYPYKQAFEVAELLGQKKTTVRKNWNKKDATRKKIITIKDK